jgi:hypothetical protein
MGKGNVYEALFNQEETANYIGLANKAFDVGYKIVCIIFTGMTEDA